MTTIREYTLNYMLGSILEEMQKSQFDESTYFSEEIFDSWRGLEDFALLYEIDTSKNSMPMLLDDCELSCEKREMLLQDEYFAPYIELARERFLPAPQPDQMFYIGGQVKTPAETNWGERFESAANKCQECRDWHFNSEVFFPYVIQEDDGSSYFVWPPCSALFTDMSNNACLIKSWEDDGRPNIVVHCRSFERV